MTVTLVTGANKGLGYETAKQLIAAGHTVYLGCRNAELGQAAAEELGGRFIQLDVTSDADVTAAAEHIRREAGRLDVLVNSAGISGGFVEPEDVTAANVEHVLQTNTLGAIRTTHAFLNLLRESSGTIVNVSSGLGSFGTINNPERQESMLRSVAYSASKSALNMATLQYSKAFPELSINVVDPGYTSTDLNGNSGTQSVAEGAEIIVKLAKEGNNGPTGGYFDRFGSLPW